MDGQLVELREFCFFFVVLFVSLTLSLSMCHKQINVILNLPVKVLFEERNRLLLIEGIMSVH